jgi:hypothetical protein
VQDELKDLLAKQDIVEWTANRLKNMGVKVVTVEEQRKTFLGTGKDTDEQALTARDKYWSSIYVNVHCIRVPTGEICANITLQCWRGVFVHPGYFMNATVWDRDLILYLPSDSGGKDKIRQAISELFNDLENDWKKCNP